ncbi:MAG: ABC transporter permease [Nanoarchaeota archaeon]
MIQDYVRLAISNLMKRRLRSWLTMLGVIIGIAAVISLIGIGEGLRLFVTNQFNVAGADVLTIQASGTGQGPPGTGVVNPLTTTQLERIRDINGVKTALGRIIQGANVEFNDKTQLGFLASMPDSPYRKDVEEIISYKVEQGRLLKDGDNTRIVVGNDFTNEDRYGKKVEIGSTLLIEGKPFTVVGILKKKGSFTIDSAILMNEDVMRTTAGRQKEEYDIIAAQADKGVLPKDVKENIEKVLRKERNVKVGEEDFTVETSESALRNLNSTLFAIQLFVYIIAGISIIVGGIGITNTMYTAVLERINDIGTMKAIGARNSDIFTIFFAESGLIGMIGGAIGIALGYMLAQAMAAGARAALGLDMIQAHVSPWLVLGALLFSFIVGTLAGLLPAYQASKLNPVDALNYTK